MAWTPKSSAPATFNLVDATIALITGDATWGWLLDWLPYVTNDHFSTADFCAQGPPGAPDLSVALGPSPPDRNPWAVAAKIASISISMWLAAKDRVFGAYCEQAGSGTPVWGPDIPISVSGTGSFPAVTPEWVAPAGTTGVRGKLVSHTGTFSLQLRYYAGMTSDAGPFTGLSPLLYGDQTSRADGDFNTMTGITNGGCYASLTLNGTMTLAVAWLAPTSAIPYTPMPQVEPAGVLSPLRTVDASLAGIAAEAERLELKLDTLLDIVQAIAGSTIDLAGPASDPADLPPDTPVEVKDAVGCILVATGIPASRSLDFGEPQNIVKLGHINFGTSSAWYPSIWMTHSPMVVRPFPPGTTRVTVTDLPPGVSVTISMIAREK